MKEFNKVGDKELGEQETYCRSNYAISRNQDKVEHNVQNGAESHSYKEKTLQSLYDVKFVANNGQETKKTAPYMYG